MEPKDEKKNPKTQEEKGVAENEKTNYSSFPPENADKENKDKEDRTDIRETDNEDEVDDIGGNLAGNAAGNTKQKG